MQAKLGFDRESQKDMEKRVAVQRKSDMHKLAGDFETAVGEIIETVVRPRPSSRLPRER